MAQTHGGNYNGQEVGYPDPGNSVTVNLAGA
jgi:hypothetical protein